MSQSLGMVAGMATNFGDDVPLWLLIAFGIVAAAGWGILFAAYRIVRQPLPRFWFFVPQD
jgi:hypothetical protein